MMRIAKVILVKKGMAKKAFEKHVANNNVKAIQKQIEKGIVQVIPQ